MSSIAPARSASFRGRLFPLLAFGAIAAFHLRTLRFGFLAWDDPLHVTANPLVIAPNAASSLEQLTTPALGYPIPITVLAYRIEAALFGLAHAWGFHLVSVLLHVSVCALVWSLARRMRLPPSAAATACLLVGLHPVVAEPVSWISGQKDLLATLVGLSALAWAWPTERPERARLFAAISCYGLGLLAKPTIAPLCLLLPIAQVWFGSRAWRKPALWTALGCLALLTPIAIVGVVGQRSAGAIGGLDREGASYIRAFWYALGHHLNLLWLWQEPTAKYVPSPWPPPFTPFIDLAPLLAAAAFLLIDRLLTVEPRRVARFGALWAVLTYLPNSNLIPLARYLADSYLYLPLFGVGLIAAAAISGEGTAHHFDRWRPLVPIALCIVLGPLLLASSARFQDDETLWAHALARYPNSARICRQWANGVAIGRGPHAGLIATDHCIARFGPDLFAKNRGLLLAQTGQTAEAESWLMRARAAHPDDESLPRYLQALHP